MRNYLECVPCFSRQDLEAARIAGADEIIQKKIIDELSQLIPDFPLEASSLEMGRTVYTLVRKRTGVKDPYKEIKESSNKIALSLYPELKQEINNSEDRLLTAVKLSIVGNVIDYGVKNSLNVEEEINKVFNKNFKIDNKDSKTVFRYQEFKDILSKANHIIYLADNAGEVVFDRLLIEELTERLEKRVIYVVRGKPIIKDALIEDAIFCGINKVAKITSSGSDAPGTIIKYCSSEFIELYQNAKLIISKGQGNYESLSGEDKPIFFLFKAKCPVIAKDVGCKVEDMVLKGV